MTLMTQSGKSMDGKPPHLVQPNVPKGFEHINRYWDKRQLVFAAKILPGEFYVSKEGEMIATVLGSCVSACIRDKVLGIGGMNHFMLPVQRDNIKSEEEIRRAMMTGMSNESTRYGNWAMEFLINEILKLGGKKENLEVKLFGGSRVIAGMKQIDVGAGNIEFVKNFLLKEGFEIASADLGGVYPRKVLYFPDTGSVKVRKLKTMANDSVIQREQQYAEKICKKPKRGDIELF